MCEAFLAGAFIYKSHTIYSVSITGTLIVSLLYHAENNTSDIQFFCLFVCLQWRGIFSLLFRLRLINVY